MRQLFLFTNRTFDWLEHRWEGPEGQRLLGTLLVVSYVLTIAIIEVNRLQLLPPPLKEIVPTNHLLGIELAFNLLLLVEIFSLVLSLAHSVATAAGKQFEILSLILIRDTFKEFSHFHEPILWEEVSHSLDAIFASATGALIIFVLLGFYYRALKHQRITRDEQDQFAFIATKKLVSLALLVGFFLLSFNYLWSYIMVNPELEFTVFEEFYTLLVFSDILIVLTSLRYSSNYIVAFRNSGFAVSTVLIRLALIAPVVVMAFLGVAAALFNLGVLLAYNKFGPILLLDEASLTATPKATAPME